MTSGVAILAGGTGTRLRPVVSDRPKPLAPVAGRPFIAWLLDGVAAAGFAECVLCTGYMADAFQRELGERHGKVRLRHSIEAEPLGTGGALRLARALLPAKQPVVVLNGDSFCGADLAAMDSAHAASGAPATMATVQVPDAARFGRVHVEQGNVVSFEEKKSGAGPGTINAGIYVLSAAVLDTLPEGASSLERDVLPSLAGMGLRAFEAPGPFLDIGTPDSYAGADRVLAGWIERTSRP